MICNKCGNENSNQISFCAACGESLKDDGVSAAGKETQAEQLLEKPTSCYVCDTKITEDTIYCHMCGSRQKTTLPNASENSDHVKKSDSTNKCPICGGLVSPGTETCAVCAVSNTALQGSGLGKPKKNTDKIADITTQASEPAEKLDANRIEPIIDLITKMKPAESQQETKEGTIEQQSEKVLTKTEKNKAEEKETKLNADKENENKANNSKSNAAQEFLPEESSEENLSVLKSMKSESAKKQAKTQDEKQKRDSENIVPENTKTQTTRKNEPSQTASNPSDQVDGNNPASTKVTAIKGRSASRAEKQTSKTVIDSENRTSQWKSVQVTAGVRDTTAPLNATIPPHQQSAKHPEMPRQTNATANSEPAQRVVPNPFATSQQQGTGQGQLPSWHNASAHVVPAQTAGFAQQQAAMTNPSGAGYSNMPAVTKTKQKGKKAVFAVLVIVIAILLGAAFGVYYMSRSSNYDEAMQYMQAENYTEAYNIFVELGSYKDSEQNAVECYKFVRYDQAAGLMNDAYYKDAAEIFSELGDFKDSAELLEICTVFSEAIDFYNDERYWYAYSTFEKLNGYGDSEEWMRKCIQTAPANGIAEKGEAYAEGTAGIKIFNSTDMDVFFVINTMDGRYWGGIYIHAGMEVVVAIKSDEYTVNLAVGVTWFGTTDMFGRGQDSIYQQNAEVDEYGNTSFLVQPNETKSFTIYS